MTGADRTRYQPWRGLALWGDEEETAALEVLRARSMFRYYGPHLLHRADTFEHELAEVLGVPHTVGVSSGTAALACALVGMGLPAGAEVVVPAVTFVGCVGAVVWARGVPVFAEVDDTLTMDPTKLDEVVTERTWGVMPVHLGNVAADMDPILAVARRRGLRVLEDAAQAVGVRYHGQRVGALGDTAAFSFQLEKNLTAGEGGAVSTNDSDCHDRMVRFQDQGGQFTTSRSGVRGGESAAPFVGVNLRMTELTAAILSVQLRRLDPMLNRLRDIARQVRAEVSDLDVQWRRMPDEAGSGGDLTLFLDSRIEARRFVASMTTEGIPAYTLYQGQAVYANPAVRDGRTPWGTQWPRPPRCRASEGLLGRSVTIGLGSTMTDHDVSAVIAAFRTARETIAARPD